jgi:AbrB family looped-hinge helix DNA binding protein
MVRLQKRFAYKYKDKDHYKYIVTIPSEAIEKLELLPNTKLEVVVDNRNIILKPTAESSSLKTPTKKGRLGQSRRET